MPPPKKGKSPQKKRTARPDAPARYSIQAYPDGSWRPERGELRETGERRQAVADLYGDTPLLSTGANMRDVSSILTELVSHLHIEEMEIAPHILAQAWQQAAGSFLSTQAELVSLSEGAAIIRTLHPAVRYELQRHRAALIHALNDILGEGCVQSVRIIHG